MRLIIFSPQLPPVSQAERYCPRSGGYISGGRWNSTRSTSVHGMVLSALTVVDEDQHAAVAVAEIARAIERQLLAAMERHPGAPGAALVAACGHD